MDPVREHRFYVENLPAGPAGPAEAGEVARAELPPGEAHHAVHVLRLRAGARVELFDGRGAAAVGKIESAARGEVVVVVEERLPAAQRCGAAIHLAFAVPKGKRLDWLLEKATELAAASLTPVLFERSVAGADALSPAKRERWRGHCIAAAKQCGLDLLPTLEEPIPLGAVLARSPAALGLLGERADACSVPEALARWRPGREILLLVGPEGGLTDRERAAVAAAGFGAVRVGATTLRIETAAIALLAAARAVLEGRTQRSA